MTKKKQAKTLEKLKRDVLSHLSNFSDEYLNTFLQNTINESKTCYELIMKLTAMVEVTLLGTEETDKNGRK